MRRQFLWIILAIGALLCLYGCHGVAPKKTVNIPQQWPIMAFAKNKSLDLAHLSWWKQFNDAQLNALMQKTLSRNNELHQSLARIEQAQSQLEQIKFSWLPKLDYLAGYTQFPILGNPGALALAYPTYIVNVLQLYKKQQSAKALYQASIEANNSVKITLLARTAASYFIALEHQEALMLYQQLHKDQQQRLHYLRRQYQSGLIPLDALLLQERAIQFTVAHIALIKYNIAISKNALHYLADENPGELVLKTRFAALNAAAIIPGNQPLSVLRNRPDVKEAELLLDASHANVEAVKAIFFPEINLGSYLGTSGNQGQVKLGQIYVDGPLVDASVFAQIKEAKARDKALYFNYRNVIRRALRDVANDLTAYQAYTAQLQRHLQALKETQKQCALVNQRFRHGLENAIAPLDCAITLDELHLNISQSKLEKILAVVTLYQDLGGGYDELG